VACGIDALPLESWNGQGIIDGSTQGEVTACLFHSRDIYVIVLIFQINHIISLAGWGVTSDGTKVRVNDYHSRAFTARDTRPLQYWIGRNSWGTVCPRNPAIFFSF
jgi:hypothetical protein